MWYFKTSFYISSFCTWLCFVAICIQPNPVVYFFFGFNIINALLMHFLVRLSEKQKERQTKNKTKVEDLKPID